MIIHEGPGQTLIDNLAGTTHPETGREPVVVDELKAAIAGGQIEEADEMAHNYTTHGHIDSGLVCSPDCYAKDFPVE